jgi:hypothetical protein
MGIACAGPPALRFLRTVYAGVRDGWSHDWPSFLNCTVRTHSIRTTVQACARPGGKSGAIRGAKWGYLGWL